MEAPAVTASAGSGGSGSGMASAWSRMRAPLCGLLIMLAALGLGAAQDGDAVRRALSGLGSSLDLQTSFPVPKERTAPWWLPRWLPNFDVMRVLVWVAVACGAAALAWYLMDIVPRGFARQARWGGGPDGAGLSAVPGTAAAAQVSADELASHGRFAEAMHVLLLQSVSDMRKRLDVPFADSLTSREILRRAPVSDVARGALADLITAVERAYFGQHAAGEGDYRLCRTRFSTLSEALGPGGRP